MTASPFGIPFPASRNPQEWQAWHQRVRAQLEARRNTRARANASGTGSSGIIETIAGAAPFQTPVNALKTGLGQIQGIAEDSNGNLYVASCDLGVVLKIDSASNTTVYAGQPLGPVPLHRQAMADPQPRRDWSAPLVLRSMPRTTCTSRTLNSATVREVNAATGSFRRLPAHRVNADYSGTVAMAAPATCRDSRFPERGLALDGNGRYLFIKKMVGSYGR